MAKGREKATKVRSILAKGLSSSSSFEEEEEEDESDSEEDVGRGSIVAVTPSRSRRTPQKPNNFTKV